MAYDDDLQREFTDRMHRWARVRYEREGREFGLGADERLDDLGWEIFYCAIASPDHSVARGSCRCGAGWW